MGDMWHIENGVISISYSNRKIKLWSTGTLPLYEVPDELKGQVYPAEFCLYEWQEYLLETPLEANVTVGDVITEKIGPGLWRVNFANQIGHSSITVHIEDEVLSLPVLVLSPKFPSIEEHMSFFKNLVNELANYNAVFPFTIENLTSINTSPGSEVQSVLFVYHFFRSYGKQVITAIETILFEPHRLINEKKTMVRLPEVTDVNSDVICDMVCNVQEMIYGNGTSYLEKRLNGCIPVRVRQWETVETFDTPENRFIRYFINKLLYSLNELMETGWIWNKISDDIHLFFNEIKGFLEMSLLHPVVADAGEMMFFPANSQVLYRRPGYRELLNLWSLFESGCQPFFDRTEQAIKARDIAILYEMWCFFKLAEIIGREIYHCKPNFILEVSDEYGLGWRSYAIFDTQSHLIYNPTFTAPKSSYSVTLRPDYALVCKGKVELVFDAKFRFDVRELWASGEEQDEEKVVKQADIYKMHTYKDALGVRAAVVLFPGDRAVFYNELRERHGIAVPDLISAMNFSGVGAIPLVPVQNNRGDFND